MAKGAKSSGPKASVKSSGAKAAASRKKNAASTGAKPTAVCGPNSKDKHLSVRKINNGYVVRESYTRNGQYVERETYTPKEPKITIANAPKAGGGQ